MINTMLEDSQRLDEAQAFFRRLPQLLLDNDLKGFDLEWVRGFCPDLYSQIKVKESLIENSSQISLEDFLELNFEWLMLIKEGRKRQMDFDEQRNFPKDFPRNSWYERR